MNRRLLLSLLFFPLIGCASLDAGARFAVVAVRVSAAGVEPAIATAHAVALARCDGKPDPAPCRAHVEEARGAALRSAAHLQEAATQAGDALESLERAVREAEIAIDALARAK